jgi:hypothetical protein
MDNVQNNSPSYGHALSSETFRLSLDKTCLILNHINGKLSDTFSTQNVLKQGDALQTLLFNFGLYY